MSKQWCNISLHEMKEYMYHKISVYTHDGRETVGWVYTIDPITESIVLYFNGHLTTMIGHAISAVSILEVPTIEIKEILNSLCLNKPTYNSYFLQQRQEKLAQWLRQNRFPVNVIDNKITVANVLDILPPYNSCSCHTSNEIILGRIQKLIETMPM